MKVSVPWLYVECALTFGTSCSLGITPTRNSHPKQKKISYHGSSSTMVIFLNSHNNMVKKYKRSCISIGQVGSRSHGQCNVAPIFVIFSMVFCICPPQEGPTRHKETQGQLSQFLARDWKRLQDKRYYFIQAMPANSTLVNSPPHKHLHQNLALGCVGEYSGVMCAFAPFSFFPHLLKPFQSFKSFIQNLMVCFLLLWKTLNLSRFQVFFSIHSN